MANYDLIKLKLGFDIYIRLLSSFPKHLISLWQIGVFNEPKHIFWAYFDSVRTCKRVLSRLFANFFIQAKEFFYPAIEYEIKIDQPISYSLYF